jgi:hypothetical protein
LIDLYDRLTAYLDLLASRPDVHVHRRTTRPPGRFRARDAAQLPPSVAAFYGRADGLAFWWVFANEQREVDEYRAGYNGGWLNLRPLAGEGVRWSTGHDASAPELANVTEPVLCLDDLHDDARTYLTYFAHQGPELAMVCYVDTHPSANQIVVGEFEGYLREGARYAFALDWQRAGEDEESHAAEVRRRLLARSVPPTTARAELDARLRARGASPEASASLIEWLGGDVALLLPP